MSVSRIIWWMVTVPLGLVGAAVAAFTIPPAELVAGAFAAAVVGGVLGWLTVAESTAPATLGSWRSCLPTAAVSGTAAAAVTVSIVGLITLSGAAAVPLVFVMIVTAPPVTRRLCSWPPIARLLEQQATTGGDHAGAASIPDPAPDAFAELSDEALCHAWRTSFTALQNTSSVTDQLRLARTRQYYLDEIERRDPQGFAQWFHIGVRAGSDPSKFLTPGEQPPPAS
ncbi:hypothetical protein [Antrihabitans stalactiti]|uniref:Uncharacterized protein n=1 Tax=Antrihabitans stalactiti TaxID=2584121 RepID=A0A848KJ28_9NOCA|nr:hypothetical protein [Antrihabitans stalactiti]NMN99083.1 hypothetical protein [Antrihabitans stalactiti]